MSVLNTYALKHKNVKTQKSKHNYLNNLNINIGTETFRVLKHGCQSYFSNQHSRMGTSVTLIEKELILNNMKVLIKL